MYSIKRDHWVIGDLKVVLGDKVKEDSSMRMHPLPDSQSSPSDGLYTLKYIPINKTDIFITGQETRDSFADDDYDGYQTGTFDYMVKNFDELPPIIFEEKEDGTYKHIDGHHRIITALELGRKEILAFIKELDQSGEWVNKQPAPKFSSINKPWLFNIFSDETKWAYFYKGKRINKSEAIKYINTGELKATDLKYLEQYNK